MKLDKDGVPSFYILLDYVEKVRRKVRSLGSTAYSTTSEFRCFAEFYELCSWLDVCFYCKIKWRKLGESFSFFASLLPGRDYSFH